MTPPRVPAFWRVVRTRDGVREYLRCDHSAGGDWTIDVECAVTWRACPTHRCGGRPVPVYHSVRKVPRGHDFAWAWRAVERKRWVRPLDRIEQVGSLDALISYVGLHPQRLHEKWVLAEVPK